MSQKEFKFAPWILAVPLYLVIFIWFVYWFEVKQGFNFNTYGIHPRHLLGLRGIFLSPFIHGDVKHLYHNSAPLFVLLFSLFYFYREIAWKVLFYGAFLTGLLTWIIGRNSYHIGASGIIYMLFSFIFLSGVLRKNYRLVAVSLMVIFLYGSMVWYVLPVKESISWEGHLSGLLIGIVFAIFYRSSGPQKFQYDWEKENYEPDEFDQLFEERETQAESGEKNQMN
ncbi:rhomboid family intramembrane serine protease [Lutimonas sp.]|uniref:rhomboid family intramembrane serine protease n=1 Tax=Lutimonas sp. TaxID=1872403 RepID=UPI003D9B59F5